MRRKRGSGGRTLSARPTDARLLEEVLRCIRAAVAQAGKSSAARDKERWYERSYEVFARAEPWKNTPDGLVKVLAFAASWLPTIPEASPSNCQEDADGLTAALVALEALHDASAGERRAQRIRILQVARRAFGLPADSLYVVCLSKALHFCRPELAPMVDGNVTLAWKGLCERFSELRPRSLAYPDPASAYLEYWESAWELVRSANNGMARMQRQFTFRDLDVMLFRIGKEKLRLPAQRNCG